MPWAVRNISGFLLLKARVSQARQPVLTRLPPRKQWAKAQTSLLGWVRCNMQRHQPNHTLLLDLQLCSYLMPPTIKLTQHFYHFTSYKALSFVGKGGMGFGANVNKPLTSLFWGHNEGACTRNHTRNCPVKIWLGRTLYSHFLSFTCHFQGDWLAESPRWYLQMWVRSHIAAFNFPKTKPSWRLYRSYSDWALTEGAKRLSRS